MGAEMYTGPSQLSGLSAAQTSCSHHRGGLAD
jgi:hypothetical protein